LVGLGISYDRAREEKMINEVVSHAAKQVFGFVVIVAIVAAFVGLVVGLYFLDKFRWGYCP
jgi:predicted PurR-regulated permease PerM